MGVNSVLDSVGWSAAVLLGLRDYSAFLGVSPKNAAPRADQRDQTQNSARSAWSFRRHCGQRRAVSPPPDQCATPYGPPIPMSSNIAFSGCNEAAIDRAKGTCEDQRSPTYTSSYTYDSE